MEVGENRFGPPRASSICTCGVRPDPDFIGGRSRENSNKGMSRSENGVGLKQ